MASIDRTAYPRFKRVVSVRELAEAFTPVADEVVWARGRSQGEPNFLALVVLLKCYQRLGYFPKLGDVPVVVVNHVRTALRLPRMSRRCTSWIGRCGATATTSATG